MSDYDVNALPVSVGESVEPSASVPTGSVQTGFEWYVNGDPNKPLTLRERIELAKWLVESVDGCDDTERAIDFISEQIHGTKGEAAAP